MKETYFRIIELPEYQLLLTKNFNNKEDEPVTQLTFAFFVDGNKVELSLGYASQLARDEVFDTLSDEEAGHVVDGIVMQYIEDSEED